jgi:hypothetical protein
MFANRKLLIAFSALNAAGENPIRGTRCVRKSSTLATLDASIRRRLSVIASSIKNVISRRTSS